MVERSFRTFCLAAWLMLIFGTVLADEYPQGCVSCHAQPSGKADFRLNYLLGQLGHRWIKTIKDVPGDCKKCHSADADKPLMSMIHEIHYDVPKGNLYVTSHGGECLHCHSMNVETGEAGVKNGPRNW